MSFGRQGKRGTEEESSLPVVSAGQELGEGDQMFVLSLILLLPDPTQGISSFSLIIIIYVPTYHCD